MWGACCSPSCCPSNGLSPPTQHGLGEVRKRGLETRSTLYLTEWNGFLRSHLTNSSCHNKASPPSIPRAVLFVPPGLPFLLSFFQPREKVIAHVARLPFESQSRGRPLYLESARAFSRHFVVHISLFHGAWPPSSLAHLHPGRYTGSPPCPVLVECSGAYGRPAPWVLARLFPSRV